jgi:prepilin-type N-terminal cleavage/methylation domain-containing protein/prepilin-type processing-associated H-X9-DG protein
MFVTSTNHHGPSLRKSIPRRGFTLIELLVVLCVIAVLVAFLLPAQRGSREAPRRTQCRNNLKQLGLALHNYHDVYGAFPPAYTVDADGKPLHSWRTLLLPYLDHKPLYDRIDLSKRWDDPVNADVFKNRVQVYVCPSHSDPDKTPYLAAVTPQSVLRAGSSCTISDITDGTSNTVVVLEVDVEHAVRWMMPQDADEAAFSAFLGKSKRTHNGGGHALFGDGAVRFLSENLDRILLTGLTTVDGGEKTGDY